METYTKKVLQHFKHPRNVGIIKNPDGVGEVGNPVCGDVMRLYIKVGKDKKKKKLIIKNIKFQTFGCIAAITTSSILTEMAKGKTIEDALKITNENIVKGLGGLPPVKYHCSLLSTDALQEAIYDYFKKNKIPIPEELENRHRRIVKGLREAERKHSEYIKAEREMMRN